MRVYTPEKLIGHNKPFLEEFYDTYSATKRCRRFGRAILRESTRDSLDQRLYDEVASTIVEALDGTVRSHYVLPVADGEPLALNGEPLRNMMARALELARDECMHDSELGFMVDRFEAELDEVNDQCALIKNGAPSTLVTFSPYTAELIEHPELLRKAMQDPRRRRSMMRVSHWDGRGMHIFTLSLDNGDLEDIAHVAENVFGHKFSRLESLTMLRERFSCSLDLSEIEPRIDAVQELFIDKINAQKSLNNREDLHSFVYADRAILMSAIGELRKTAQHAHHYTDFRAEMDRILYNYISLYDSRLNGEVVTADSISGSAQVAGDAHRDDGYEYDPCGYTISAGVQIKAYESLSYLANKFVRCPNTTCNKLVVIDQRYLDMGILHCKECLNTVDVCGDSKKAERVRSHALQRREHEKRKVAQKLRQKDQRHRNPDSIFAGFLN